MAKHKTPLLDQLESGPWPSFVSDLKQQAEVRATNKAKVEFQIPVDVVEDLLGVMELSYKHGRTHWKHGGIVGVFGYGGGVIGRYCDQPQQFPGVAHFHTLRVNQPGGKFYTTKYLRQICDLWDFRGSGITNMHGSTGDIIFLGTTTPQLEEIFYEMTHTLNLNLTVAPTVAWLPSPVRTCLLSEPGGITSASTRKLFRLTSAAKLRPMPMTTAAVIGVPLTSRKR
jgi:sulfite reductase alpha subunit